MLQGVIGLSSVQASVQGSIRVAQLLGLKGVGFKIGIRDVGFRISSFRP